MSSKFSIGQQVRYTSMMPGRPGASGAYSVVRVMPREHAEQQYCIKHNSEAHERVVHESQLEKAS